jgi:putative tryptophan/tyrosine transport system substrate-binding protein
MNVHFRAAVCLVPVLAIAATSCSAPGSQTDPASKTVSIAVTQIVEHPSLNAARDGLKDGLAKAGYIEGKNLKWQWQSAQGNPTTAVQIAQKFAGETPTVIVPISTPSAQAVAAAVKTVPIVFSTVTDPIGAKLVNNLEKPGGNITGVSALVPVDQHVDLIRQLSPNAKRIGVIYNAGESNSVTLVRVLKQVALAKTVQITEATVTSSADVVTAARSLVGKADVIYVPTDNTVASALESVLQVGIQDRLPIYSGDNDSVQRGAIASLGFNYYDVGQQSAELVVKIIKGEKPGDIPVQDPTRLELYINTKAANAMGVTVPDTLLKKAAKVIR